MGKALSPEWTGLVEVDEFMAGVRGGTEPAGHWTRLAVQRSIDDHEAADRNEGEWEFDAGAARHAAEFKRAMICSRGRWRGQNLVQQPWQAWRDAERFGWRHRDTRRRRFRESYTEIARKNGKTADAAATANYFFLPRVGGPLVDVEGGGDAASRVYFCATKREQAEIGWSEACRQWWSNYNVPMESSLRDIGFRVNQQFMRLHDPDSDCLSQALAGDSTTVDGLDISAAVIDEYHAHKSSELVAKIRTAQAAREDGWLEIITTAGLHSDCPCFFEERWLAIQVLSGALEAPRFWACIWSIDQPREWGSAVPDDDWLHGDEDIWRKANPSLDNGTGAGVKSLDYLRDEVAKARVMPSRVQRTGALEFGVWADGGEDSWLDMEAWRACEDRALPRRLRGARAVLGVDLAEKIDLCAVAALVDLGGERVAMVWRHLVGTAGLQRLRQFVPGVEGWLRDGWLWECSAVVRVDDVVEAVDSLITETGIQPRGLGFDPWHAAQTAAALGRRLRTVEISQTAANLSPALSRWGEAIADRSFRHCGDPVAAWQAGSATVKWDSARNARLQSPHMARGRAIDGLVAGCIAIAAAAKLPSGGAGRASAGGGDAIAPWMRDYGW